MSRSMIDRRVRQEWLKGGRIGLRADPGWTNKKRPTIMSTSFCALLGTRTLDPLIKSQLLYQLS